MSSLVKVSQGSTTNLDFQFQSHGVPRPGNIVMALIMKHK